MLPRQGIATWALRRLSWQFHISWFKNCLHVTFPAQTHHVLLHTVTDKPDTRPKSNEPRATPDEGAWSIESSGDRLSWQRPDVQVVLVHPQIPQNAGSIARTCAGTAVALHLVEPLAFEIDDKKLKRSGLDYWPFVCVKVHKSWGAFYKYFQQLEGPKRLVAYTVYGTCYYAGPEFSYQPGDWLVFGAETSGLPAEAHLDIEQSGGALVKIPIVGTHVRSLNLAVSAGVGLFEAIRQLDQGKHEVAPRQSPSVQQLATRWREGKYIGEPVGKPSVPAS